MNRQEDPTVLLIGGDAGYAETLQAAFQRVGWRCEWREKVGQVPSLEEQASHVSVVVCDLSGGRAGVADAVRMLSAEARRRLGIRCIVVTDTPTINEAVRYIRAGATDYLPKEELDNLLNRVTAAGTEQGQDAERRFRYPPEASEMLIRIAKVLSQPEGFQETVRQVLQEVATAFHALHVVLRVPEERGEALCVMSSATADGDELPVPETLPIQGTLVGQVFQEGRPIIVSDYASYPMALPFYVSQGIRSAIFAPVRAGDRVAAILTVTSAEMGRLGPEDADLLEAITSGLGALFENVRLTQEVQVGLEQHLSPLETLRDFAGGLRIDEDNETSLHRLVESVRGLARAQSAFLALWGLDDGVQNLVTVGYSTEAVEHLRDRLEAQGPPSGLHGPSSDAGQTVLSQEDLDALLPVLRRGASESHIAVPLRVIGERRGILCITSEKGAQQVTQEEENIVRAFAALAESLLENSALYQGAMRERSTLGAVLSSITEGLMVVSRDGRIVHANDVVAKMVGSPTAEHMEGRSVWEVAQGVELSSYPLGDLLNAPDMPFDKPLVHHIQQFRPARRNLAVTLFPINAVNEALIGVLLRDVTEEALVERRKDAFLSIAAHEVGTPLTSIMGFADLLLQQSELPETQKSWLGHIYSQAKVLSQRVGGFLNVARIQSGTLSVNLQATPLEGVIRDVVENARLLTDKHEILVNLPSDSPVVYADPACLGLVIDNLVSNAVKYSPLGGRVTVAAKEDLSRGVVVLSVADEGIGIAPEDQAALFRPFSRVQRPEIEGIDGIGLGLYIVKELVWAMQGEVWLESAPNAGATFYFTLPRM